MPLQNRVDPFGTIFRSPARGSMMGNRGGALHNDRREIVRPFKNQRWIACLLEFRGRRRVVMSPRQYTELFFLDEAVALAAGHRPCAECRRDRFRAFLTAWERACGSRATLPLRAPAIDAELHSARVDGRGRQVTYESPLDASPDGCFVEIGGTAYLVWGDGLLLWTPERYAARVARPRGATVTVLTPAPTVECLRQGYRPEIHPSAHSI